MVLTRTCLFVAFVMFAASSVRAAAVLQFELVREIPAADFASIDSDRGQVIDLDPITGQFIIARGLISDERPVAGSIHVFSVPFDGGPRTPLFTYFSDAPMSRHALRILPNGNFVMPTPDGLTLREYDRMGMPVEDGFELTLMPQPPLETGGAVVLGVALDFDHGRVFVTTGNGFRLFDLNGIELASTLNAHDYGVLQDVGYDAVADTVFGVDDRDFFQLTSDLRPLHNSSDTGPEWRSLTFDPRLRQLHLLTRGGALETYAVTIVPEPATGMLATVAGAFFAHRRRKRRMT